MSEKSTIEMQREVQLEMNVPYIWEHVYVLYIGANVDRFHFKNNLRDHDCQVDILEIDEDRCRDLEKLDWINKVIHGDVADIDHFIEPDQPYDLILWSHGPEILEREDLIFSTIEKLINLTYETLVLLCPWGRYDYTLDEKKHLRSSDINKIALYPDDFLEHGFSVSVLGKKDVRGSNLLAWRCV